ncbi:hypothetical protein Aperf_G00000066312 [Anoplocephala perfoliata]
MQTRYASNSSEAGDERETWSSSSMTTSEFPPRIHPQHHHHFYRRPDGPISLQPPPLQQHRLESHAHHHRHYGRRPHEWYRLKDTSSHSHSPSTDNQKLPPYKTLGIEMYETENLQSGIQMANSRACSHSAAIPELPPFQRRCAHALADIITSPYTAGLPALIGVFLRPDGTRRSAFNKQLASVVLYGGLVKRWKFVQPVAETLLRYARSWRLIVDILFYKPQKQTAVPSNIRLLPVSLKLGASESSWDAVLRLSEKMWEAATSKYSKIAIYLQYASEDAPCQTKRKCRKSCCLPAWACVVLWIMSLLTLLTALRIHVDSREEATRYKLGSKIALVFASIVGLLTLVSLFASVLKPIRRLARIKRRFEELKKEKSKLLLHSLETRGETKASLLSNGDDDDASIDRSTSSINSTIGGECGHSHHRQPSRDVPSLKQSPLLHNGYDGLERGERIDAHLEAKLRMESMANCHTLHRLDSRSDRQTRFLLSIDATALAANPATAPQRLAEFSQIINRVFTSSPQGESGVIWHLDDPKEMTENLDALTPKNLKESAPNVPNIIVILVCKQDMLPPCDNRPESERVCDYWQSTLDACHLTVFIDEPTEGPPQIHEGNNSLMESHHSIKSSHCSDSKSPSDTWPIFLSFPDFFVEEHPLGDVNIIKLKNLIIHMAFLGRMLKTSENRNNWTSLLEVTTTWLCLLVHFPFHTAWLSLFLEEHYACNESRQQRHQTRKPGGLGSVKGEKDAAGSTDDDEDEATASTTSQPVLPDDTLPMLYSRVLERLAPALSTCRTRGGTSSSQMQSPASHRSGGSGMQGSAALRLSELASRDCGPTRLAALLRHRARPHSQQITNQGITAGAKTTATVRHLVAVMTSSPLINPKTRARIQSHRREFDQPHSTTNAPMLARQCPVRVKNGLPRKSLSKMTVDEICLLVSNMTDLCINHNHRRSGSISSSTSITLHEDSRRQTTPHSNSRSTSIAAYLLRLRALNISGAVLTMCSLNESLRREIGMTPGDWHLFSELINHLKNLEKGVQQHPPQQHNCQCARSVSDLASIHAHWHHTHPVQPGSKPKPGAWNSESILGAATLQPRWRHDNDSSPSPLNGRSCVSNSSGSIESGSCTSVSQNWRGVPSQRLPSSLQDDTCRLSGGSCSVYSAELSCSASLSEDTVPSAASSPSISSIRSSTLYGEAPPQRKMTPTPKHWRYDVDV